MSFDLSVADKDRDEPLSATIGWRRLAIATLKSHPVPGGEHGFEVDLYGRQAERLADRRAGIVAVRFVRLPSGDSFGWGEITVDPKRPDWHGVIYAMRDVAAAKWGPAPWRVGVEIDTHVPRLVLRNRILIATALP